MDTKIILSATWIGVMLIDLLGDMLRIISGDVAKAMAKENFSQSICLGIAVLILIPILMIFLSLVLPQPANRWANIIVAGFFILFNLACQWNSIWHGCAQAAVFYFVGLWKIVKLNVLYT